MVLRYVSVGVEIRQFEVKPPGLPFHEIPIFEAEEQRALTSESFVTAGMQAVNPDS